MFLTVLFYQVRAQQSNALFDFAIILLHHIFIMTNINSTDRTRDTNGAVYSLTAAIYGRRRERQERANQVAKGNRGSEEGSKA